MIYVFHGEDEFSRSEEIAKLKMRLGDATLTNLNVTVLDGHRLSLASLIEACSALPFLSQRRMVIVEDFWSSLEPRTRDRRSSRKKATASETVLLKGLLDYLPQLPETARLLFVEGRPLGRANPVHSVLPPDGEKIIVREFRIPQGDDLVRWVIQRVRSKDGEILAQAAQELILRVGNDLRQLDQEVDKLLAYVNYKVSISSRAVEELVSTSQSPRVFAFVDALGMRQGERALRYLHELLDGGAPPLYLLTMIERQFRILLQVKSLAADGMPPSRIQTTLGIHHRFIVDKSLRQVQRFSQQRLEDIYQNLADVEYRIKSGEVSDVLALDVLVVETCS